MGSKAEKKKEINKGGIVRLVISVGAGARSCWDSLEDGIEYATVTSRLRGEGVGIFIHQVLLVIG